MTLGMPWLSLYKWVEMLDPSHLAPTFSVSCFSSLPFVFIRAMEGAGSTRRPRSDEEVTCPWAVRRHRDDRAFTWRGCQLRAGGISMVVRILAPPPVPAPVAAPVPVPVPPRTLEEALKRLTIVGTVVEELEREGTIARQQREAAHLRYAGGVLAFLLPLFRCWGFSPSFLPFFLGRSEALAEIHALEAAATTITDLVRAPAGRA